MYLVPRVYEYGISWHIFKFYMNSHEQTWFSLRNASARITLTYSDRQKNIKTESFFFSKEQTEPEFNRINFSSQCWRNGNHISLDYSNIHCSKTLQCLMKDAPSADWKIFISSQVTRRKVDLFVCVMWDFTTRM